MAERLRPKPPKSIDHQEPSKHRCRMESSWSHTFSFQQNLANVKVIVIILFLALQEFHLPMNKSKEFLYPVIVGKYKKKNPPMKWKRHKRGRFKTVWVRKTWEVSEPTPVFCLKIMDKGIWWATVHGVEWLWHDWEIECIHTHSHVTLSGITDWLNFYSTPQKLLEFREQESNHL